MRKAVVIAVKSRRGIPLSWNERFQDKHLEKVDTELRIVYNRRNRRRAKSDISAFRGIDWEDFIPSFAKNCISCNDW